MSRLTASLASIVLFACAGSGTSGGGGSSSVAETLADATITSRHSLTLLAPRHPELRELLVKTYGTLADDVLTENSKALAETIGAQLAQSYVARYAALASDAAVGEYWTAILAALDAIVARDDERCVAQVDGASPQDASAFWLAMSPAERARATTAGDSVITSSLESPQAAPDPARAKEGMVELFGGLQRKHGPAFVDAVGLTLADFSSKPERLAACRRTAEIMRAALALPDPPRRDTLRSLLSGS